MADSTIFPVDLRRWEVAEDASRDRFFTATGAAHAPTAEQIEKVASLRERITMLGTLIEYLVPPGRNQSLALTALEDVQMRANRGIFAPQQVR